MMLTSTKEQLADVLADIGIERGDGLFIHSAVQYLGKPEHGIGQYYEVIGRMIGADGTVAVPTFSFHYAQTKLFDPSTTPSRGMGIFSEFVRKLPAATRTTHPMQSISAVGKDAAVICSLDTPGAFDDGSAFDFIQKKNYKVLLLGADIQAVSLVHFSEQRANVPYRFWKDFPGKIKHHGQWIEKNYRMFVRDLVIDPHLNLKPVEILLKDKKKFRQRSMNYGSVSVFFSQDFIAILDQLLAEDPWVLVER